MSTNGPRELETVIIGGGQAGLSVGYHLARRDRSVVILDANGRIGDSWRNCWDSLRQFTPARYDGLPGWPFPASSGRCPPRTRSPTTWRIRCQIRSPCSDRPPRGRALQRGGPIRRGGRGTPVRGRQRRGGIRRVSEPQDPRLRPRAGSGIVQLHSSEYRNPSQLQEGGELVVGAANSGAEIALEVSRAHRTWLSGRHPGQEPSRPGSRWDRAGVEDDGCAGWPAGARRWTGPPGRRT